MEKEILKDKVCVITGAGKGIGLETAKLFYREGAKLALISRDPADLAGLKKAEGFADDRVLTYAGDVSEEKIVVDFIGQALAMFGRFDVLVNNAGIIRRIPILDMPIADFKQVLDVDLVAPLIVSKRVVPGMIRKRSGKVINMCSMMSIYGRNTVSAYASAKGGLKLLTANMTCEWAKYNIQINGIGPGYIATSQTAPIRENGHPFNDLVMTRTPAGRWGEPEDVANAALFLASGASDFVNGHILFVDGGILANFGYVKGENEISEQ